GAAAERRHDDHFGAFTDLRQQALTPPDLDTIDEEGDVGVQLSLLVEQARLDAGKACNERLDYRLQRNPGEFDLFGPVRHVGHHARNDYRSHRCIVLLSIWKRLYKRL